MDAAGTVDATNRFFDASFFHVVRLPDGSAAIFALLKEEIRNNINGDCQNISMRVSGTHTRYR